MLLGRPDAEALLLAPGGARQVSSAGELPDRYSVALDLGLGCGLRQGEAFAFSPIDVRGDSIHIERQILRYKSQLYFGPPKGGKRDAPLSAELHRRVMAYQERFEVVEVTLPWLDAEQPDVPRQKRRLVTVPLLITATRRQP